MLKNLQKHCFLGKSADSAEVGYGDSAEKGYRDSDEKGYGESDEKGYGDSANKGYKAYIILIIIIKIF